MAGNIKKNILGPFLAFDYLSGSRKSYEADLQPTFRECDKGKQTSNRSRSKVNVKLKIDHRIFINFKCRTSLMLNYVYLERVRKV